MITVALATLFTLPAQAAHSDTERGNLTTGEGSDGADTPVESQPVKASYRGRVIDLSKDWEDATVYTEVTTGDVRRFKTEEETLQALAKIDKGRPALLEARENGEFEASGVFTQAAGDDFGTQARSDCAWTWVCLWDTTAFGGRKFQWQQSGTKKMADWGFRDQTGSIYNNRFQGGAELIDYRTLQPDPRMFIPADSCYN